MTERFTDSVEATEFIDDILRRLKDARLKNWIQLTTENYYTLDLEHVHEAIVAGMQDFINILNSVS